MERMSTVSNFQVARKPVASKDVAHRHTFERILPLQDPHDFSEDENKLDDRPATRTTKKKYFLYLHGWTREVLSCLLAIVALAAIIITLVIHQGRPLPQWPHLISINTLIAVFTSIFKAALVMPVGEGISQLKWLWYNQPHALIDLDRLESASRGPWGSFLLIWRLRRYYLALFGALIMIIALAIDPFSQQIIQYKDCPQPISNTAASVSQTNNYTTAGFHVGAGQTALDAPMINALYSGLINPPENSTSLVLTQCPTGNCTFPSDQGASYSSTAMCHSCEDISSQIKGNGYPPGNYNGTWSIPSDANITSYVFSSSSKNSLTFPNIFSFDNLMMLWERCILNTTYNTLEDCVYKPWAVRCSIFPCLQTYGGNISQAILREVLLESTRLPGPRNEFEDYFLAENSTLRDGVWQDCKPSSKPSETNPVGVQYCAPTGLGCCNLVGPLFYYPNDCVWSFGQGPVQAIGVYLDGLMIGQNVTVGGDSFDPRYTAGNIWIQNLYRNGTANMSTVNTYMEGLTNSITATMHQRGDSPSSEYAQGAVLDLQTCITVQWAWISLPATLFILVLVFLGATMLQAKIHLGDMIWKSSSLALLFHGLSPSLRNQYGTPSQIDDMKTSAEDIQTRLERTDVGWAFVEQERQ